MCLCVYLVMVLLIGGWFSGSRTRVVAVVSRKLGVIWDWRGRVVFVTLWVRLWQCDLTKELELF